MLKIIRQGRYGTIEGHIDKKLNSALFNKLAYQKQGWQFMPNPAWSWVRFYNIKKQMFAWGLINKVKDILNQWQEQTNENYIIHDLTLKINKQKSNISLRPYQKEAVERLITNKGGIISMPTGSGKTRTAISYLQTINLNKILIIVHTIDLKNQWLNRLNENGLEYVEVKTWQSIKNFEELNKLEVVIFDECHHVPAKSIYKLAMKCDNAIMIGLSATPYRSDGNDMKLQAALGDIVYCIELEQLISEGYLCPAEVRLIDINYEPIIDIFDTYMDIYDECIVHNKIRNEKIIKLAIEEHKNGLVLILVDRINHGKLLEKMFEDIKDERIRFSKFMFVHGKSKDRKKKLDDINKGLYDIVIATQVYNEGIDIPRLKTLILGGNSKSTVKVVQQLGRTLRLWENKDKTIIYDFKSKAKYLKTHYELRKEIYYNNFEVIDYDRQKKIKNFI